MEAECGPQQANLYDAWPIHVECSDGGAADNRLSLHLASVAAPSKVLVPFVMTRIEQRNSATGNGIYARNPRPLGVVAHRTGQAGVCQRRRAAQRLRYDMVDFESGGAQILLQTAVFAKRVSPPHNGATESSGDERGSGH